MPVKRVSALSQIIKEKQEEAATPPVSQIVPQNAITALPQNNNMVLPQTFPTPSHTKQRKTDTRDKVTFYLDPGQRDKLDDLRRAYKERTGQRLNEQDFMRLIVERLNLGLLLKQD